MGWMDVFKGLLAAFSKLLKDLPVWAKVVMAFAIFLFLVVVTLLNLRQIIVYDVEILAQNGLAAAQYPVRHETMEREGKTDDNGRINVILVTSPLDRQENLIVIQKPIQNVAESPIRIRYGFRSHFWRSDITSLTLNCDFGKQSCDRAKTGDYHDIDDRRSTSAHGFLARGVAYAGQADARGLTVPALATLVRAPPDGGYTRVMLKNLAVGQDRCGRPTCPDSLVAAVEWNGVQLLFDGLEPFVSSDQAVRLTKAGRAVGTLSFGIPNTIFAEGTNQLRIRLYSRPDAMWGRQQKAASGPSAPLDTLTAAIILLRNQNREISGQAGIVTAKIETETFRDRTGRSYEVWVGAGTESEVGEKRAFVNKKLSVSLDGQKVVATVRPPLPGKRNWGVALAVQDGAGGLRVLFSETEAQVLLSDLKGRRTAELGPLRSNQFFANKVAVAD